MSEYLNFCLRTYKYTCPRVWGEPFHILRTYVLLYASCLFPVSSKAPPIYFGTPILAPSSKLRPRCGKALVIKIVHGTFYSRECLLLSERQEMHAGEGGGGRCWKHQMGSVNPEKWESKMGGQPGQVSAATSSSQSCLGPEKAFPASGEGKGFSYPL